MANEVIVKGDLEAVPGKILRQLKRLMSTDIKLMQTHIREKYFGSYTGHRQLKNRSGKLRNAVRGMFPAQIEGMAVKSGIIFGTQYAASHVGPKGQKKTIRPKKGSWLTVPFSGPKFRESERVLFTPRGVLRGGALSGLFRNTFIAKSKAGNLIIFGQKKGTRSMRTSQGGKIKVVQGVGKVLPLFVLKKEVQIPYRIHPLSLFKWFEYTFAKDIKAQGIAEGISTRAYGSTY